MNPRGSRRTENSLVRAGVQRDRTTGKEVVCDVDRQPAAAGNAYAVSSDHLRSVAEQLIRRNRVWTGKPSIHNVEWLVAH